MLTDDASLCRPLGLAGLAEHLFWTEPSNLLLTAFLREGHFHQICQGDANGEGWTTASVRLLRLLSHIFMRQQLHPAVLSHPDQIKHSSTSRCEASCKCSTKPEAHDLCVLLEHLCKQLFPEAMSALHSNDAPQRIPEVNMSATACASCASAD